jgi:hypothetical protein
VRVQSACFQRVAPEIGEIKIDKRESAIVLGPDENQKTLGTFGNTVSQFHPWNSDGASFSKEKKAAMPSDPRVKRILIILRRMDAGAKRDRQKVSVVDEGAESTLWKDQSFQHIRTRFLVRSK